MDTTKHDTDIPQKKLVVSIKTFGCQMNMFDSEVAEGRLLHEGFEFVAEDVRKTINGYESPADVVLLNTCSVREHAEDRVYSRLGMLARAKENNPNLIVGLMGCMVEEHREKLFRKFPLIDLMVGTRNIKDLPELIKQVTSHRSQVARIKHDGLSIDYTDQIQRKNKYLAWLPIMTGCNKVCTFCIVPITRGVEVSMPAREVYREASRLVSEGVKWITLLGQNVNSYDGRIEKEPEGGSAIRQNSFPELLEMLCQIEGLDRISFTTSHPEDATEELFKVIARNPKISRRFHLPLQSGSDRILKRMKRLHSYEQYRHKINRMREIIPDVSVTTDIIAGFSGESEEDHLATAAALKELRYDGAYIYKYSVRPGTPASNLEDDVPIKVKDRRNQELLEIQREVTEANNRARIGKTLEVFVESTSTKNAAQVLGLTHDEKKVVFDGPSDWIGTTQKIVITGLHRDTLLAEAVSASSAQIISSPIA